MNLLMIGGILLVLGMGFFGWCLCAVAGMADEAMEVDPFDSRPDARVTGGYETTPAGTG